MVISGALVAHVYQIVPDRVIERLRRAEIDETENVQSFLNAEPEAPRDILRGPLIVGREWANAPPSPANPDGTQPLEIRRIEGVDVTVNTPAGRFQRAIKVRIRRGTGPDTVEYYAPSIGLVRREYLATEPIVSELSRFDS